MASITIQTGTNNLVFASIVANDTGATFREEGQRIHIEHSPALTIPRYCFDQAFDPEYKRGNDPYIKKAWRSLLLNKRGYLRYFGDDEIYITDDPPSEDERPSYLLRFDSPRQKERAEEWAERAGFSSLREYILAALDAYNATWRSQRITE